MLTCWHLMAFFMWLSFKIQLSAAPTGNAILTLKDLGKGKIHHRKVRKARKQNSIVSSGGVRISDWRENSLYD